MIETFVKYIVDNYNKNDELVIFDIGSRDCLQSIEFFNTFPNSKIYAFECNPNTLDICRNNIKEYNDRIILIEGAVCDYDGKQENSTQSHRLDSLIKKYSIPRLDIISIHLQGSKLLALKGLGNYLHNVKYIYTKECHNDMHDYVSNVFCFDVLNNIDTTKVFTDVIYKNRFLDDPIFSKINLTYDEQTYIRGKPKKYLLHAIDLFKRFTNGRTILEIGSVRQYMNHDIIDFNNLCCNDGHSTYFWKQYTNADIYTIDIDPNCKYIFDNDKRLNGVHSYTMDAFEFVKDFNKKIDLLFLDAWDVLPNTEYDIAHLNIYNELKYKLSDSCIILIDDTDVGDGGKGKLLIPQLIKDGFLMITNKRQSIFIKNNVSLTDLKEEPIFDIVIPIGPNDIGLIYMHLEYTKKNIIGYRNIYLLCYDPTIDIHGCITIDEKLFPFTIETVRKFHGKLNRNGWYLQQLLKLYAGKIIPGILERYLVIDSDTLFLKPTVFIENNKCLYNFGKEHHKPYFDHMLKLDKDLIKVDTNKSGICHHMMFETKYVNELIHKIEENHNDTFYNVFLKMVTEVNSSGASEYEIYFNYILKYHSDKIKIRELKWMNVGRLFSTQYFDYISYHFYMRELNVLSR